MCLTLDLRPCYGITSRSWACHCTRDAPVWAMRRHRRFSDGNHPVIDSLLDTTWSGEGTSLVSWVFFLLFCFWQCKVFVRWTDFVFIRNGGAIIMLVFTDRTYVLSPDWNITFFCFVTCHLKVVMFFFLFLVLIERITFWCYLRYK